MILSILFVGLTNYIYSNNDNKSLNIEQELKFTKDELKHIEDDYKGSEEYYVSLKTDYLVYDNMIKYDKYGWKKYILNTEFRDIAYKYYTEVYINKNDKRAHDYQIEMNNCLEYLKGDNGFAYLDSKKDQLILQNKQYNELINSGNLTSLEKEETKKLIKVNDINIRNIQYLIDNNILLDNNNINQVLNNNRESEIFLLNYENRDISKLSKEELLEYNINHSNYLKTKYQLDHKIISNTNHNQQELFVNFFNEYSLLIFLAIIIVSGTIISEEFNKGTIKSLLVRPYSRFKIFGAKLLTSLIVLAISIGFIFLLQLIFGSIFLDLKSITYPVMRYNEVTHTLSTMNIFSYFGLLVLCELPLFLFLITFALMMGTILCSSEISIVLTIFSFFGLNLISALQNVFHLKFLKYLPSLHWEFTKYLTDGVVIKDLMTSITVITTYILLFVGIGLFTFKRKDIKNV